MDWKKLKEEKVYDGWRGITKKYFELPDGVVTDYDIVDNSPFVSVAAFTANQEAILVRQYRPGPEKTLVSFCEGYIDKNETPEQAAIRELREETGYEAPSFQLLRVMYQAYSSEIKYCFLATNCKKVSSQQLDDTEHIKLFTMPLAEFKRYLIDPSVDDFVNTGLGYMALDKMGCL